MLATIIKEYPDLENRLTVAQANEFKQIVGQYFHDLTYSCLLTIRSSDEVLGLPSDSSIDNQAGISNYRRFGMRRMRALELIR